jgi:hypothetical protein
MGVSRAYSEPVPEFNEELAGEALKMPALNDTEMQKLNAELLRR